MPRSTLDRRTFLGGVAATGAASLLSACSSNSSQGTNRSTTTNERVRMPDYIPYQGVQADLASTAAGVEAGFLRYPASPVDGLTAKPGRGGRVTAVVATYAPAPPALAQNEHLQAVNDMLGVELNVQFVPGAEYTSKLATIVASDDLPDLMQIFGIGRLPELLRAKFADLTEHLSGPAVKKYPFLANIPTASWKTTIYNGAIYGLPIPRAAVGPLMLRRDDLLAERGLDGEPTSFAEFAKLCRDLTDTRKGRWAMAFPNGAKIFVQQMLGVPNGWRAEGGKFTASLELDETKKAISDVATLWKAGVFHPDSLSTSLDVRTLFGTANLALHYDNYTSWSGHVQNVRTNPKYDLGGMLPPNYDSGSKRTLWQGWPSYSLAAFKRADPARIEELLGVANALATPFGTQQHLLRRYGVGGVHYDLEGTDPIATSKGTAQVASSLAYLAEGPPVLYEPGLPEVTKEEHAYQTEAIPIAEPSPLLGLYSETQGSKGAQLDQAMLDVQNDIISGRKPLSAWDEAVGEWRRNGGDQIRSEYEKSLTRA